MYTVVRGDSLSRIADAQKVRGGWRGLYAANRRTVGADPDLILPGQRLKLRGTAGTTTTDRTSTKKTSSDTAEKTEKTEKAADTGLVAPVNASSARPTARRAPPGRRATTPVSTSRCPPGRP